MSHFERSSLAAAVLFALTSTAPTLAQVSAADKDALTTVVVTGEKIQRPLEKTLSSVAVTTDEELRNHADVDLHDVFLRTPGLFATEGNNTFSIRGIPFDGIGSGSSDVISVYVDDTLQSRRSNSFAPSSMWDIQQVEIYRGTQSLIQGRNALAGTIVIKSKDPTFTPEASLRTSVGAYGEHGSSAVVSGGLIDETLAGRLAFDYQEDDGYIDNVHLDNDANPTSDITLRGKLLIQPRSDLNVLLTLLHSQNEMGNQSVNKTESGEVRFYEIATNVNAVDKVDKNTLNARVDYQIDTDWTLTSISAANRTDYEGLIDFGQDVSTYDDAFATDDIEDFFSQELRLAYDNHASVTGLVGVYLFDSDRDRYDALEAFEFKRWTDVDISSAAVFGELSWQISPAWAVSAGVRYDREKYTHKTLEESSGERERSPTLDSTVDAWLPKFGLTYTIDDHQTVGVVAQRGYRAGGASYNFATLQLVEFDPEYTDNYELAYRGLWLDQRLRLNVNVYRIDWEDQQVSVLTDPADDNSGQIENAGESRLKGGEASVAFMFTPALEVYAGVAYNDAEYKEFVTDTQDFSGYEFERAPFISVSAGATLLVGDDWSFNLAAVHHGETNSVYLTDPDAPDFKRVTEVLQADAFTLWNFGATYAVQGWTLSAYVKNLFDRQYLTNNQEGNTADVGAPRTGGIALRYDF